MPDLQRLRELQALPLERKVGFTAARIKAFNVSKIDNTESLRIGLNEVWLSLNDLQCAVEEACQNNPKLQWSAKCSSCPFYLDLEDEARNLVTFCMAQIGNIGNKQITKYIKENYNG